MTDAGLKNTEKVRYNQIINFRVALLRGLSCCVVSRYVVALANRGPCSNDTMAGPNTTRLTRQQ